MRREEQKEKICYVVGAGENYGIDFTVQEGDYVIAADGGGKYLEEAKIMPNLIIGDFDSLQEKPKHTNVITLSKDKDETDTFAAIKQGIDRGYKVFCLHGCTGGRIDHTLANIQILAYLAQHAMQGFLFDKKNVITTITDTTFIPPKYEKGYLSVFSYSKKSKGVSLKGLKYELDKEILRSDNPIGVSNEFIGEASMITVECGTLVIVYPRE